MPYKSISEANPAIRGIKPPVTLAQANMIAGWADSIEEKGEADSPWGAAIALFKRTHHVEDGKWVKNAGSKAEHALDGLLDMMRSHGVDLDVQPERMAVGVPAYVVDLFTELPQKDGKPDFSQPFRILPAGIVHFRGTRTVTEAHIDEFADNWTHRESRGIRRKRVVIDVEHEPGGVALYADIFSQGEDGLWAKIKLTPRGHKVLNERDFYYFSPTVAWESKDRVTGQTIHNQIVGGALTNFPVFGDDTALPTLGYSKAALARLWQSGQQISGYATKTDDGVEYPASAWLIVEDPQKPNSWGLRVKEYVDGNLQYISSQKGDSMTIELTQEEQGLLRQIITRFGAMLVPKKKGGDTMPDNNGDDKTIQVSVEDFTALKEQVAGLATLKAQVETLSTERDALKAQVEKDQLALTAEVYARRLQEMRAFVEQFSHLALPLEVAKDAPDGTLTAQEHFTWLQQADVTDGKNHWEFFTAVLKAADEALIEAALYSEIGSTEEEALEGDALLHKRALAYMADHPDLDYMASLKEVAANPA